MAAEPPVGTAATPEPPVGTAATPEPPVTAPDGPRLDRWSLVRGLGELLVTLGCVLLLFAVYELFWTNVTADRHESALRRGLEHSFGQGVSGAEGAGGPTGPASSGPSAGPVSLTVKRGQPFAIMYIPALGRHWARAVVEGVALSDLKGTVGHYPKTQLPGEVGNFAVAGHRATNGQPLANIPRVTVGSYVYVRTVQAWYVYRVTSHRIVAPDDLSVLLPVPDRPGVTPTVARLTITTCNPRWASFQRWIVFGTLVSTRPADQGPPPGLDVTG
ncbi:MAG TPA: class E sortase [Actinomycetes bacterium]|nr:class E sortase [Actinomycetes bacterium]